MTAETIEKVQELLDKKKKIEKDIGDVAQNIYEGGPYIILGITKTIVPDEYALAMLKAQSNNLTRQLAEINEELEAL